MHIEGAGEQDPEYRPAGYRRSDIKWSVDGRRKKYGRKKAFPVVAASVERFKFERGRHLSLRDASKLLGLSKLDVIRLIENSLLTAVQGPSVDHRETWKFDHASLNEFVGNMLSRTVKPTLGAVNSLRTFSNVLDTLTVKLSSIGWGIHAFVRVILSGFITPIDQAWTILSSFFQTGR